MEVTVGLLAGLPSYHCGFGVCFRAHFSTAADAQLGDEKGSAIITAHGRVG